MARVPDLPKVILAVQTSDGEIMVLAGVAEEVTVDRDRDVEFDPWFRRDPFVGEWRTRATIEFRGAVNLAHVPNFDDIPDPERPPGELENRKAIEPPSKEREG